MNCSRRYGNNSPATARRVGACNCAPQPPDPDIAMIRDRVTSLPDTRLFPKYRHVEYADARTAERMRGRRRSPLLQVAGS
ncbi:hypothetical protein GCM10010341_10740 [Streptomyces noursei]|nr:hypothetical protein GCM10010341_10740 [Streptomyces noursei]